MTRVFAVGVLFVLASVVGAGGRAAADAPVAGAFHDHFFGPDPCTGTLDEITVTGLPVTNQTVFRQSLRDVLVNEETGARMRAGFIFVVDLATGDVKVLHGGISCIHD